MKSTIKDALVNWYMDQWCTQEFCSVGVHQIQLRTERTGIWRR